MAVLSHGPAPDATLDLAQRPRSNTIPVPDGRAGGAPWLSPDPPPACFSVSHAQWPLNTFTQGTPLPRLSLGSLLCPLPAGCSPLLQRALLALGALSLLWCQGTKGSAGGQHTVGSWLALAPWAPLSPPQRPPRSPSLRAGRQQPCPGCQPLPPQPGPPNPSQVKVLAPGQLTPS